MPSAARKRTSTPGPPPSGRRSHRVSGDRDAVAREHADGVVDRDALPERGAEALERRHRVRRVDRRAAAAQRPRRLRVGPDDRDAREPRPVERQRRALVAQQHEAGRRGTAQHRGGLPLVVGRRARGGRPFQRSDARRQPQQANDLVVDGGLVDPALAHRGDQRVAPRPARAGHDEIEPRARRGLRRPRREPVRHDEPVELPLALEDVAEQRALRHRMAVDAVVGRHHRPGAALAHDRLERRHVELAQRALAHARVERHPLRLGVVGDEVLHRRADAAALHAADVRDADPGREQRILAEALEVPPAVRRPVQVDRRRQQDVHALAPRLEREQPSELLDELLVPRRRERRRRRDVGRRVALVPALAAHAGRAVRDDQAPQSRRGLGMQRPEVRAGEQADLLLQRQRGDPRGELALVDRHARKVTSGSSRSRPDRPQGLSRNGG